MFNSTFYLKIAVGFQREQLVSVTVGILGYMDELSPGISQWIHDYLKPSTLHLHHEKSLELHLQILDLW